MVIYMSWYKVHSLRISNSTSRKANWSFCVDSPIAVSIGKKSNRRDVGITLGSTQALHAETNWAVVTNKCCCRSIGAKCHVRSDCCQNLIV